MIRAHIGHRSALGVTASVTNRARISEVIMTSPLEHRTASKGARTGHRSAHLGARQCKYIAMPSRCPTDAPLVPAPGTNETDLIPSAA